MRFWKPHENSITQYLHIFDMQWNQSCFLKSASTLTTYSHAINTFYFSTSIGYNFIVYDVKLGELRMGPSFTRVCLFCQTFFTWFVYKHTRYESDSFLFCGFDHHCNVLFTFRAWSLLPILREEKITK